jgi:nicotinate-nucleotide adenylyltransferase
LRLGFHLEPGMRVGLFGGSFDPAHEGHLHVAETALRRLRLDRVVWLVSPHNPLKRGRRPASLERRMVGAQALAKGPSMIVSDAEARFGSTYTLDTVRLLQGRFPGVRFVWLMGSDNLAGFHRWRGWTDIMRAIPLAVVARPGALNNSRIAPAARRFARARVSSRAAALLPGATAPAWTFLRAPLNAASSTAIRAVHEPPAPVPG